MSSVKLFAFAFLVGALINVYTTRAQTPAAATPAAPAATAAPAVTVTEAHGKKKTEKPTKATKAPKTTTTPKPKYNCGVCTGKGTDCKPTSVDKNVEWCTKITGTCEDPSKVPSAFFSILQFAGFGDMKTTMQQHKGEVVTIRKGAPPTLIALAGQNFDEEGCSNYPLFLGLTNATACLCKGDCED